MRGLLSPISNKALAYFYRQLATMEETGITPAAALATVADQFRSAEFRRVVGQVRAGAEEGRSISREMEKFPRVFTPLQCSLVSAGETGGTLAENYRRLADHLERGAKIRDRIVLSLIYPVAVLHIGVFLLALVDFVRHGLGAGAATIAWTLGPVYVLTLGLLIARSHLTRSEALDRQILRIPWIGKVRQKLSLVHFTRTLGALIESGVNVTYALEKAGDACGSRAIRRAALDASELVEGGRGLAEAFVASGILPPIILQMMDVGERSGRLPETLSKTSEILEDEANHAIGILMKVLPLAAFLLVAGFLAFRIIAFYAGMYGQI